ncbi:membrane protein [Terrabacter tumescens]|uniref:Membrane protein n=1 Tax=Terrabacter tumescens TaxID=60443 RepID=A0ABQ2IB34_9MICO|nr:lipid II flippase MurJ [Terrabacter tumescens]GGN05872.1 membrane protein [Terrabacter tumescens]
MSDPDAGTDAGPDSGPDSDTHPDSDTRPDFDAASRPAPRRSVPHRGLFAAAGTIAVITLVARVVGFGRWFVFSHSVGATCVGSVYQSVNAVPNVLFEIAAGGVLAAVAVPLVAGALARGDRDGADATASALLTWAGVVLLPLGVVVALAAEPIAGALLGTGCAGEVALGAELLRIFAIQVPLYGVAIVLAGVLQAHHRFVGAAVAPLLSSVVVIATYLAYRALVLEPAAPVDEVSPTALVVLGVGTTLGVVALALPLLVPVRRSGVRLRPRLRFPDGVGSRVRVLAASGLLAVAGQQVATLVVIRLANDRGGAGTLNVYTYAQAVTLLPYAVLAVPLATAAFPSLAGAHAARAGDVDARADMHGGPAGTTTRPVGSEGQSRHASGEPARDLAAATLRRAWLATLVVTLLGAATLVAVAIPVGAFFSALDVGSASDASLETLVTMGDAVTLFAPSVVALGIIGLLSRASYVRGSPLVAGGIAAAGWLTTVVLPLVVLDPSGAGGPDTLRALAGGSSAGLVVGAVLLVVLVGRTWGRHALSLPARPLVAALVGSAAGALAGRGVASWLSIHGFGQSLGSSVAVGVGVGVLAVLVMVGVTVAIDPSALRRVRRRRPDPETADVVA